MFKVQFYASFRKEWLDYTAITFNAKVRHFAKREDAERYMANLQANHPRDQFRIAEGEAA